MNLGTYPDIQAVRDILKASVGQKGLVYYVYSNLANNKIAEAHSK